MKHAHIPRPFLRNRALPCETAPSFDLVVITVELVSERGAMAINRSLSATLPRGTNLACVTTRGDSIRGNVVATDENFGVLVIRKKS